MKGVSRQLRIAVLARGIDKGNVRILRRALWPASVWQAAGYRVDLLLTPPSRTRLKRYAALVMIDPARTDELNCCDEAVELGLALIVDVSMPEGASPGSQNRSSAISAITRNCLALATIVTTRSRAEAEGFASLVPADVQTLALPDPSEDVVDTTQLLNAFRGDLRRARMRGLLSSLPQRWLSPRSPLAAPWRMFKMARSIPLSWWLTRVPRAVARRLAARFRSIAARPSRVSPKEEPSQTSKTAQRSVATMPTTDASRQFASRTDRATSAQQWAGIVEQALQQAARASLKGTPLRVNVLVLMDLIQDLDVILPIVERMRTDRRFAVTVAITDWLDKVSPRVSRELLARSMVPLVITKKDAISGLEPDLTRVNAVITACETNHPAHRVPHAVVRRANNRTISTYTLQHGLENVGLTYFEPYPDHDGPIEIASSTILTWGPVEKLPAEVSPAMRARCFAVGTPKPPQPPRVELPLHRQAGPVVAVFENLHWERYTDSYRDAFIQDLRQVAAARPEMTFLLKPHHAGRYLAKNSHLLADAPANIVLADPTVPPWEAYTASAIIGSVDAVITTPSTVALDAARAVRPVAVAGYGMTLPVYEPLPILTSAGSWLSFIDGVGAASSELQSCLGEFRMRHVIEGDAVGRILERIAADVRHPNEEKRSG